VGELVIGVPHPHHRNALRPGPFDKPGDGGDDVVAAKRVCHHAHLDVDDEQRAVWSILQSGHRESRLASNR
jgi:hypothetical protein